MTKNSPGSCRTRSWTDAAGSRGQAAGSRQQAAGSRKQAAGSRQGGQPPSLATTAEPDPAACGPPPAASTRGAWTVGGQPLHAPGDHPRHRDQLRRDRGGGGAPRRGRPRRGAVLGGRQPDRRATRPSAAWCPRSPPAPTWRSSTASSPQAHGRGRASASATSTASPPPPGPGLVGGVMVGLSAGKAIALARGLPLVAVNHLEGHAVSARLGADVALSLPAAAGLRRPLPAAERRGRRRLHAGSARPSTTRPARPSTRSPRRWACAIPAARRWSGWPRAATPRASRCRASLLGRKGCDFSFSGLKTAAARLAEGADRRAGRARPRRRRPGRHRPPAGRALRPGHGGLRREHGGPGLRFVVAGGVAANRRGARAAARRPPRAHGFAFAAPPLAYCTDNAAMIALAGAERLARGPHRRAGRRRPAALAAGRGRRAGRRPPTTPGRKGAKA